MLFPVNGVSTGRVPQTLSPENGAHGPALKLPGALRLRGAPPPPPPPKLTPPPPVRCTLDKYALNRRSASRAAACGSGAAFNVALRLATSSCVSGDTVSVFASV